MNIFDMFVTIKNTVFFGQNIFLMVQYPSYLIIMHIEIYIYLILGKKKICTILNFDHYFFYISNQFIMFYNYKP